MSSNKENIIEYIKRFGKNTNDTGSPEVQVAVWTLRIRELTEHLKIHKKELERVFNQVKYYHY